MNLSNCSKCGKLQLKNSETLCKDCLQLHIEDTRAIKDFLLQNPRANIMDLAKQTGFSLKKVNQLVNR
jgi:hypothetical protein